KLLTSASFCLASSKKFFNDKSVFIEIKNNSSASNEINQSICYALLVCIASSIYKHSLAVWLSLALLQNFSRYGLSWYVLATTDSFITTASKSLMVSAPLSVVLSK